MPEALRKRRRDGLRAKINVSIGFTLDVDGSQESVADGLPSIAGELEDAAGWLAG